MKKSKPEFFSGRINSFSYAFKGIAVFFRTQPNSLLHLTAAIVTVCAGFFFHISRMDWIAIVICIGLVFASEMMNTAIEFLTDFVSPQYNEKAGKVKDVAAASVLFSASTAFVVGLLIFLPKILGAF